jgi:hypothetical protein
VVHAKWSPGDEGSLKIWKDSEVVFERMGPNVYGTIGVEYTPYLETALIIPSGRGLASGADKLRVAQRRTAWAAGTQAGRRPSNRVLRSRGEWACTREILNFPYN